jgi:diacylglycerol kinase family enzyme
VPKVLRGTHLAHPLFLHKISAEFSVEVQEAQPVQIDGELHQLQDNEKLTITTEKRHIIY